MGSSAQTGGILGRMYGPLVILNCFVRPSKAALGDGFRFCI